MQEVVFLQLRDDERDDIGVEQDALRWCQRKAVEILAVLTFAKEQFNAILDFLLARLGVTFIGVANGEPGAALVLLVLDLGEQDFEELPKDLLLGPTLIGVNEIMAAFESVQQIVAGGNAETRAVGRENGGGVLAFAGKSLTGKISVSNFASSSGSRWSRCHWSSNRTRVGACDQALFEFARAALWCRSAACRVWRLG